MKKLSTEQENAIRDVARQCSDAIKKALKKKPKPSWNEAVPGDVQQRNWASERALWSRVMSELTPRQSEVLDAIVLYKDRTGFPPTLLELAGLIGCASPNAAAEHVKALKKKGYLSIAPGAARGITVVKTELDADPVAIIKGLLSGGDMARDNAVEWLKKQGVTL